jgi:hypothetical protein
MFGFETGMTGFETGACDYNLWQVAPFEGKSRKKASFP